MQRVRERCTEKEIDNLREKETDREKEGHREEREKEIGRRGV